MTAHLSAGLHVALHAPQPGVEGVPGGGGPDPGSQGGGVPHDVLNTNHGPGEECSHRHVGQQGGAPVVECLLYVPAQCCTGALHFCFKTGTFYIGKCIIACKGEQENMGINS